MQRTRHATNRRGLWVERVVWNTAAISALAVMIGVLLCSLSWLDAVSAAHTEPGAALPQTSRLEPVADDAPAQVAGVNRPSG